MPIWGREVKGKLRRIGGKRRAPAAEGPRVGARENANRRGASGAVAAPFAATFLAPAIHWNGATITMSFVVFISLVQCWLAVQD